MSCIVMIDCGAQNQRKGFTAVVERLLEPLLALSADPAFKV